MPLITRQEAMVRVQSLTEQQRLVAWAAVWDFCDAETAEIMGLKIAEVTRIVEEVRVKLDCKERAMGVIMVLAEGLRKPELMEWPGVRVKPLEEDNET